MKLRPENAPREQEIARLLLLCARSQPLPKGTKATNEAEFYSMARKWVPELARAYLVNLKTPAPPKPNAGMSDERLLLVAAVVGAAALLLAGTWNPWNRPGAGPTVQQTPLPLVPSSVSPSLNDDGAGPAPFLAHDGVAQSEERAIPNREAEGSIPSAVAPPRDLAPAMLPTPVGLFECTTGLWSQAEFLESIGADALDLPVLADCEAALLDSHALEMLTRSQAIKLELAMLAMTPDTRRGPEFARALELALRLSDGAERDLMRQLDCSRCNGFKRWAEMHARYLEWSR